MNPRGNSPWILRDSPSESLGYPGEAPITGVRYLDRNSKAPGLALGRPAVSSSLQGPLPVSLVQRERCRGASPLSYNQRKLEGRERIEGNLSGDSLGDGVLRA